MHKKDIKQLFLQLKNNFFGLLAAGLNGQQKHSDITLKIFYYVHGKTFST